MWCGHFRGVVNLKGRSLLLCVSIYLFIYLSIYRYMHTAILLQDEFSLSWKYIDLKKVQVLPATKLDEDTLIYKCCSFSALQYVYLYHMS